MYYFSPSKNAFYPADLKEIYVEAGSFPDDVVEIDDEIMFEYAGTPPQGKQRGVNKKKLPCWIDIPPLSNEELIATANLEKSYYLNLAKEAIDPLSDAVDFDEATDEEVERLKQWKKYRLTLTRIDTSLAPDITWPEVPA